MKKLSTGGVSIQTDPIRIRKVGSRCIVTPSTIVALPGDKITIVNETRNRVYAQILNLVSTITIKPLTSYVLTVPRVRPGIYPFAACCQGSCTFCWTTSAWPSSMPIIIVPRL